MNGIDAMVLNYLTQTFKINNMKKTFELYYAQRTILNRLLDIVHKEFESPVQRSAFIRSNTITSKPVVFLLAIETKLGNETNSDIYVFENWDSVSFIYDDKRQSIMYLQEYESYEDAYGVALEMREENKLCYNNDILYS